MTILTPKGYSHARQPEPETQTQPPEMAGMSQEPSQPADGRGIQLHFPPRLSTVTCPNCGVPYPVQVFNVIDVGQDPILKSLLLSGQINIAVCPRCGVGGTISTPLLYHDPAHEFLGVYVPEQVPVNEQQKLIGELSRALMDRLPQEARRGYMLTPQQFLSYQNLLETILEKDGISREAIAAQRRRIQLIDQALTALQDPEGLRLLAQEHDAEMDDDFFGLLQAVTEAAAAAGGRENAQRLVELRERLIELTTWGKSIQKQREAIAQLKPDTTPSELLDMIVAADDERVVDALLTVARPLVHYGFYQELAERIETAEKQGDRDEGQRLARLRDHILSYTQKLDQLERALIEQAQRSLNEILAADDVHRALREHAQVVDQTFLAIVAANLEEARRQGATAAVQRLEEVWEAALELLGGSASPTVRLINQLVNATSSKEMRRLLANHRELVNEDFANTLAELIADVEQEGDADLVARLRRAYALVRLML